jgi:hypothetical protein
VSDPSGADQASGCLVGAFAIVMIGVLIYAVLAGTGVIGK